MLSGKTAVVTGSTSGIGLGIAEALAGQGANIVLNGFGDAAGVEDLRSRLSREHNVGVSYSKADISKPDEISGMLEQAYSEFGKVDILVNNAGIQYVAEKYRTKPVLPVVNTTFLGVTVEQGVWSERCQGCGACILDQTGGVCPIARCAKSLLNGPCGGSSNGKCEVDKEIDCGWQLIVDRLKELGQLDRYEEIIPVKDWTTSRDGGPRKRLREDLRL